jgi:ribonuclease HII
LTRERTSTPKLRRVPDAAECLGGRDREILRRSKAIVGVDEVGRGSIAGPVVVGAAVFDHIPDNVLIRDSKRLTATQRSEAAEWIRGACLSWVVCEVWQELIDRVNILEATRLAMRSSIRAVSGPGSEVVVDYVELGGLGLPVHSVKGADGAYFSVAAASILAKVHRDRIMVILGDRDDRWDWSRNKGYGTMNHRRGIGRFGRSYLHRRSFRVGPVLP